MATEQKTGETQPAAKGKKINSGEIGGITVAKSENNADIPTALFIEDVDKFLKESAEGGGVEVDEKFIEGVLEIMQQEYSKFKYMEQHLVYNLRTFKTKIPEIEKTLNAVKRLKTAADDDKELDINYSLADNVWAKAHINPNNTVYLWLGANVMLEYNYADAIGILSDNLSKAHEKAEQTRQDLAFLKNQITTSEVNIARVYNHSVRLRREAKEGK